MKNAKQPRESISKESWLKLSETVKNQKALTKSNDDDVPMTTYVCAGCQRKLFDTSLYFYDKPSTLCLWCTKYPKPKPKAKK